MSEVLGPVGRRTEPIFLQVAGLSPDGDGPLWELGLRLEALFPVHVVSLSTHSVVYKVRGAAELLKRYYPELSRPEFKSTIALGHNRYSTNTLSTFEQVQPFGLLGHNGEINTIERLRREMDHLGIPRTGGSDSQDLNRMLEGLIYRYGLSLPEAMDLVFPPILGEIKGLAPELQDLYMALRQRFGPLAQGPAAIVSRHRDEAVFATDAWACGPSGSLKPLTSWCFPRKGGCSAPRSSFPSPSLWPRGKRSTCALPRKAPKSCPLTGTSAWCWSGWPPVPRWRATGCTWEAP